MDNSDLVLIYPTDENIKEKNCGTYCAVHPKIIQLICINNLISLYLHADFTEIMDIVLFVATPLKWRFFVFSQ